MAVVSRDLGYLFIMVPRTGCTAIGYHLMKSHGGSWLPSDDIYDENGSLICERKHSTVGELMAAGVLPQALRSSVLAFGAVRNPFDSLITLYAKLTSQYVKLLDRPGTWIHHKPEMLRDIRYLQTHSFSDWLVHRYGAEEPRHMYQKYIRGLDRIIRYESLQADFESVMREIGATHETLIPAVNVTQGRDWDYRPYYTRKARKVVERAFAPDFERFGYAF